LARTTVGNDTEDYGYDDGGVDADGCITRLGPLPLTWDHAHRLVRADLGGGGTARYAHDAAGQRVRTVIDAVAGGSRLERIAVDGFELIRTISGTGTTTASREVIHVMADDERLAIVETITVDGGIAVADPRPLLRHQLADHLGSSVAELDGDGSLISVEEYHSFGTTSFQAGRSATEVNLRRYRFTGHERDAETGLVQCGRRAYVPWLGRWSSPDPIGVADGTNGFVYARNNPLVFVDRAGTDVVKVVTTNNHRDLLRDAIGKVQSKTPDDKAVDAQNKRIDLSKPAPKITDMSTDAQIERDYRARIPLFGRITTKLSGFSPPGWEDAGGNEAACFKLACQGADKTAKKGETATGGGGVILYEATEQRIRTDKDASDLALAQIKRHVDAGRALVAGISEPAHKGVVDAQSQPVTDHFVDIYGYETDETGRITALFAKDNAVGGTAEVRFDVAADGSITKPADPKRKDYIAAEYQLSEVRFHTGFEYKDALRPKNDAKELMVWPNPDPKPPPPPPKPKK
jgi:RHS repeat-associated protein